MYLRAFCGRKYNVSDKLGQRSVNTWEGASCDVSVMYQVGIKVPLPPLCQSPLLFRHVHAHDSPPLHMRHVMRAH